MKELLKYFSEKIKACLENEIMDEKNLEEIRLRVNRPIILKYNQQEKMLSYTVKTEDILETLEHICENSVYAYQKQIASGYITIKGGHRIGIAGNVVMEGEKAVHIKYISSLNFRIARQIIGCSKEFLPYILEENKVQNTLIVSPPGAGKTTILRDIVRTLSNGTNTFYGRNIGVVDERGEIAASYKGIPQNDMGIRTDILNDVSKALGMKMLVRAMAPEVIIADEIGCIEDIEAIKYAVCSGVAGIFTAHGGNLKDLTLNPALDTLISSNVIEKIIFLQGRGKRGKIEKVYFLNKNRKEYMLEEC